MGSKPDCAVLVLGCGSDPGVARQYTRRRSSSRIRAPCWPHSSIRPQQTPPQGCCCVACAVVHKVPARPLQRWALTVGRGGEGLSADEGAEVVGVRRWYYRLSVRRRLACQDEGGAQRDARQPATSSKARAMPTAPHYHPRRTCRRSGLRAAAPPPAAALKRLRALLSNHNPSRESVLESAVAGCTRTRSTAAL